jgi:hypothetical protein
LTIEQRQYAPATINLRLAIRPVLCEAADVWLLSLELAAGIRRVKGVRRVGGAIAAKRRKSCRLMVASTVPQLLLSHVYSLGWSRR